MTNYLNDLFSYFYSCCWSCGCLFSFLCPVFKNNWDTFESKGIWI